MITAASAGKRRWGLRDDDESPYVSLPYGSPSPGQYFGPAMIGGPPGSRVNRSSYRSRNAYTTEIVMRLQQRFKNFENNKGNISSTGGRTLDQTITHSDPDIRSSNLNNMFNNSIHCNDANVDGSGTTTQKLTNRLNNDFTQDNRRTSSAQNKVKVFQRDSVTAKWKSLDYDSCEDNELQSSGGAVSVSALIVKELGDSDNGSNPLAFVGDAANGIELPKFESYDRIGLHDQPVLAVPPSESSTNKTPLRTFNQITNLNAEQCREAMVQFASHRCCYGQKPAKEHEIIDLKPTTTLHYILETYCEYRTLEYNYEPYDGKELECTKGSKRQPPLPWSVPCEPDQTFHQHTKQLKVPNTDTVKDCHSCGSFGKVVCSSCSGSGCLQCNKCEGKGQCLHYIPSAETTKMLPCSECSGARQIRCEACEGDGHQRCDTCVGQGQLKCYLQLNVTYSTHHDDFVMEEMELPSQLHERVSGILIYQEEQPEITPLSDYPVQAVASNSEQLVEKHRTRCLNTKHIKQRQSIWALPVTEVSAEWRGLWKFHYWIYGKDRKVYCPDYPHQCCGCLGPRICSIL